MGAAKTTAKTSITVLGGPKTSVTNVSQEGYVKLVGLLTLAREHQTALNTIEDAMLSITGETEGRGLGHTGDVLYDDRLVPREAVDCLLDRLGITAEPLS